MKTLPARPHAEHLKSQAKDLLRAYRARDPHALQRLREFLPAAAGRDDAQLVALDLKLHDAQSCLAREYGFASWTHLKVYVDAHAAAHADEAALLQRCLLWTFGAGYTSAKPELAARALREHPHWIGESIALACATGDVARVRARIAADPNWARARSTPQQMSPLLCVCFSGLIRLPEYAQALRDCAARLLAAGADANDATIDPTFPDHPLSALYGAAGRSHDVALTQLLLAHGAEPNDGESLYHAIESADDGCVRALLAAGARVPGSNALYHLLDYERPATLRLLLDHGADPNETGPLGCPLAHAIRRRRSVDVVRLLLDAGADPNGRTAQGLDVYRQAQRMGLTDVAALLRERGAAKPAAGLHEDFLAACARADASTVRALLAQAPATIAQLSEQELRMLPELAAVGADAAVRLMVDVGWPIAARGGDIDGSALNQAVFRGNAPLTAFLLARGASVEERHGYDDNVYGTLSFASRERPVPDGDWLGCAQAIVASGARLPEARYEFDEEVAAYFESVRA